MAATENFKCQKGGMASVKLHFTSANLPLTHKPPNLGVVLKVSQHLTVSDFKF